MEGWEILVRGWGFFHQVVKICQRVILTIQTFFKTKNNILLILNIDKTKISVSCVYKDYANCIISVHTADANVGFINGFMFYYGFINDFGFINATKATTTAKNEVFIGL